MRVAIDFTYLKDNLTEDLINQINSYPDDYEVVIWINSCWVIKSEQFTRIDVQDMLDFLNTNNIKYTAFNIDTRHDIRDKLPAYVADIYIPNL